LTFGVDSGSPDVASLRERVREGARNVPGVYVMRSARGDVLYVGKSTQLRARLLSYFRLPWPTHRHARMLRECATIVWEETPNEFAALLREVRLIRAHLPRYNQRSARPLDRWWVITTSGGVAPRLLVQRASTALRNADRARESSRAPLLGPFSSRAPLVDALRVLNDALGLRDCPDRVPLVMRDAFDLFDGSAETSIARTPACHRYETRRCIGPCVAACTEAEYSERLARAHAVFEGMDTGLFESLQQDMAAASASLAYERAGWLRNRLAALSELDAQLERVMDVLPTTSGVLRVGGHTEAAPRLYLILQARVVAECEATDPLGCTLLDANLRAHAPTAAKRRLPSLRHLDEMLMVEQWLRAHPDAPLFSDVASALAVG
jgi:excinuclease ABC subunit C